MALGDPLTTAVVGTFTAQTTEAVVATSPILPGSAEGGQGNLITGVVNLPTAVATSVITVRVRQNSLTGAIVATAGPYTVPTAGVGAVIPFAGLDVAASGSGIIPTVYVVTQASTTAASNAGSVAGSITPAGVSG